MRDPTFSRFDTILECDRQTDIQTHTLVGSLNFESVTLFHGMATPSGDRHIVKNNGSPRSAKIGARGNAYLTIKS